MPTLQLLLDPPFLPSSFPSSPPPVPAPPGSLGSPFPLSPAVGRSGVAWPSSSMPRPAPLPELAASTTPSGKQLLTLPSTPHADGGSRPSSPPKSVHFQPSAHSPSLAQASNLGRHSYTSS